jgi:aminoglycoside phosphotransferase family enzyme
MERLNIDDLLVAAAYPHPIADLQVKETHVSWVVLTGPFAYKIKKPVHYDFIDASTLERRRFLCDEEIRLNRRFAPDLYAGLVRSPGTTDG